MAKHRWRALIGLALMLLSSSALALGLGEIRVKSGPGQPLIAEIPIISNEPGELEQLRAELASPATFERVGLPRPQGLVNDLDFAVALDDAGRPIIRVTSRAPVDVPVLNFLVSVDWGRDVWCANTRQWSTRRVRSPRRRSRPLTPRWPHRATSSRARANPWR